MVGRDRTMATFSERLGLVKPREIIQINSMDESLRTALWNVFYNEIWLPSRMDPRRFNIIPSLYKNLFNLPLDEVPQGYESSHLKILKECFFDEEWYVVYDVLEIIVKMSFVNTGYVVKLINGVLAKEMSGYRFVNRLLVPISDEEELKAIEDALNIPNTLKAVKSHLADALNKLSDRTDPDYRNSIKESISAVEAICKIISGDEKASLGEALKIIKKDAKVEIHSALNEAFSKLYGYSSDADGIRHALLKEPNIDFEDAKFMFISCSSFINYLIVKCSKAGIEL